MQNKPTATGGWPLSASLGLRQFLALLTPATAAALALEPLNGQTASPRRARPVGLHGLLNGQTLGAQQPGEAGQQQGRLPPSFWAMRRKRPGQDQHHQRLSISAMASA